MRSNTAGAAPFGFDFWEKTGRDRTQGKTHSGATMLTLYRSQTRPNTSQGYRAGRQALRCARSAGGLEMRLLRVDECRRAHSMLCAPTDLLGAWKCRGTACRARSSRSSTWLQIYVTALMKRTTQQQIAGTGLLTGGSKELPPSSDVSASSNLPAPRGAVPPSAQADGTRARSLRVRRSACPWA